MTAVTSAGPLALPAPLPRMPDLEVSIAGGGRPACDTVTTSVRAAAIALAMSTTTTARRGIPGGWEGASAGAAGSALSRFARAADVLTAALEVAVRALDVYDGQLVDLDRRWRAVDADRVEYETARTDLAHRVAGGESLEALAPVAHALSGRREGIVDDAGAVLLAVAAAEDRLITGLRSVDGVAEERAAADDPERVDAAALRRALARLADGAEADPWAVAAWWRRLSGRQREVARIQSGRRVGGADGLPVTAREAANRALLERDLDLLQQLLDRLGELGEGADRYREHARAVLRALASAQAAGADPLLLLYDPRAFGGDGRGAIALGDPDTADDTAVLVPGLTTDLSSIDELVADATAVQDEVEGARGSTAVIAWTGYDAPSGGGSEVLGGLGDLLGVTDEGAARAGGEELADLVTGLRAGDIGEQSHLTVVGHSYGSTTSADGAAAGATIDDLVLLGSPGAGSGHETAGDLGLVSDHVYVGSAENDPVTWLGGGDSPGLGPDPAQESFGGHRFPVDPGPALDLGNVLSNGLHDTHDSYYDPGSASLDNVADVVRGDPARPPDETPGRFTPARDRLGGLF